MFIFCCFDIDIAYWCKKEEDEYEHHLSKSVIHPSFYYYTEEYQKLNRAEIIGDFILAKVFSYLEVVDEKLFDRSNDQRKFHESIIIGNLKNIYRHEFNMNITRIMKENNWDIIRPYILIVAPRRMGKTTTIGIIIAVFLLCILFAEIAVFSSCVRLSLNMLNLANKVCCIFPEYLPARRTKNKELILLEFGNNDMRHLLSLPNSASKFMCSVLYVVS
jgi:hypothetical protein